MEEKEKKRREKERWEGTRGERGPGSETLRVTERRFALGVSGAGTCGGAPRGSSSSRFQRASMHGPVTRPPSKADINHAFLPR